MHYLRKALAPFFLVSAALTAQPPVPTLINGRLAPIDEFPASVWVGMCTATVVGERAVLVAAHCVNSGQKIAFTVGASRYSATCTQSADYRRNYSADYALCYTDRTVSGIVYERVNSEVSRVSRGDTLLLSGYGCRRAGGGGGIDGAYRIGESKVVGLPSSSSNYLVTSGGAALCFGDSGGPAFHTNAAGQRVLVSTNSRGDIRTTSYLSATHTPHAQRFFAAWFERTGAKICGFHSDAVGCRGSSGPGTPQDKFSVSHDLATLEGKMRPGQEERLSEVKSTIEAALDSLP